MTNLGRFGGHIAFPARSHNLKSQAIYELDQEWIDAFSGLGVELLQPGDSFRDPARHCRAAH